jgi:hypothetical protein
MTRTNQPARREALMRISRKTSATELLTRSFAAIAILSVVLGVDAPAHAQGSVPKIPFDSVPNPLRLPPNMYFGEVSGVSVAALLA